MGGGEKRWTVRMGGPLVRLPDPVGYSETPFGSGETGARSGTPAPTAPRDAATEKLRVRKLWEAARSPVSGVFMSMFMTYMIGNSIQIFPLIMLGMTCMNAFKGLFAVTKGLSFFHFISIPLIPSHTNKSTNKHAY